MAKPTHLESAKADAAMRNAAYDMHAALLAVLLFVKPTKTNAAALNAAHRAVAKAEGRE